MKRIMKVFGFLEVYFTFCIDYIVVRFYHIENHQKARGLTVSQLHHHLRFVVYLVDNNYITLLVVMYNKFCKQLSL